MSCASIQSRLQGFLDGKLGAEERAAVERHLASCDECRELTALLRLDLPEQAALDLSGSILERTSGSPCDRAEEIVCDYVDDALEPLDRELLELHNDSCAGCGSMTTALAKLSVELPAMAEMTPPASLLEGVLAATTHKPEPLAGLWERLERGWAALLARPRLAWETGYVGAMCVWLIVSLVGVDLKTASVPLPPPGTAAEAVGKATDGVGSLGKQAWQTTGEQGIAVFKALQTNLDERVQQTEPAREQLRHTGDRFKQAARDLNLKESSQALGDLTREARNVVHAFIVTGPSETTEGE
jgi:anti-sigma factor RsiW